MATVSDCTSLLPTVRWNGMTQKGAPIFVGYGILTPTDGNDLSVDGKGRNLFHGGGRARLISAPFVLVLHVEFSSIGALKGAGRGKNLFTGMENFIGGNSDRTTGRKHANRLDGDKGHDKIQGGCGTEISTSGGGWIISSSPRSWAGTQ